MGWEEGGCLEFQENGSGEEGVLGTMGYLEGHLAGWAPWWAGPGVTRFLGVK